MNALWHNVRRSAAGGERSEVLTVVGVAGRREAAPALCLQRQMQRPPVLLRLYESRLRRRRRHQRRGGRRNIIDQR